MPDEERPVLLPLVRPRPLADLLEEDGHDPPQIAYWIENFRSKAADGRANGKLVLEAVEYEVGVTNTGQVLARRLT